jgi:hypothetical protein
MSNKISNDEKKPLIPLIPLILLIPFSIPYPLDPSPFPIDLVNRSVIRRNASRVVTSENVIVNSGDMPFATKYKKMLLLSAPVKPRIKLSN